MHKQCVIIILAFIIGKEITAFEICGTVSSSPVQEGQNAYLEYIPKPKYYHKNRLWLLTRNDHERVILFNSANRTSWVSKYSEVKTVTGYTLTIKYTTVLDEGRYAVQCLDNVYSYSFILNVTKGEPASTLPYTHKSIAIESDETRVTQLWTSNHPSSSAVYRTDRHEAETTTVSYAHRSSTIEPDNAHVTRFTTSKLPYTTVVYGDRTYRQDFTVKTFKQEDGEEPTKDSPNQSTTTKEKTSASTEKEKGINIEELKLLIPITGSAVGIVVAVAVGTVCVTVRKKKRNEDTHIERSEVESDDKGDSHRDGRSAEVVQGLGGFQVQGRVRRSSKSAFHLFHEHMATTAHPSSSDATPDVQAQACEPPEYASVIPKEKRASEAKQNTKKTESSLICDNKETENQLVYAELDLRPVGNNRPATSRYEATEYVTIDFSRTETSQVETSLLEQTETTEYVSVDFSRSETSEADTGLPEQKPTTEYVSVDFSKTRTSEADTNLSEQKATTEYVSVYFAKTGTSETDTGLANQNDTTEYVSVDLSKKAE